jgi:hypothetical protein
MRFLAPTPTELAHAAQANQRAFEEVYDGAPAAPASRSRRTRLAVGFATGSTVFTLLAAFAVLRPDFAAVAELAIGSLIGWLTILSILLAVRPMQAAGERACLALVLRRYGFGTVAVSFGVCWVLASCCAADWFREWVCDEFGWLSSLMEALPLGVLGGSWVAAGVMLAQVVAEAGASHRELVGANFQELVRSQARTRGFGGDLLANARIQSVIAGMARSIETAIEHDDLEDLRQSIRFVSPVIRELVGLTPEDQYGWDYSANNRRQLVDAHRGTGASQPVIVDIRLATALSSVASAPCLPPVPSLLLDLRHIWLSATFAAIRLGRPGIVAGSCAVAFTAYRDAHRDTRESICEHFVDAATEFMRVLQAERGNSGCPAFTACRRPVIALFAHLARLAAQRGEWDNFKHFAEPLVNGLGDGSPHEVAAHHRSLCCLALADLAGWLVFEASEDSRRCKRGLRVIRDLLAHGQSQVDLNALIDEAQPDSTEWDLGTEYWCTPALEQRGRFGSVTGAFVETGFRIRGLAVLIELGCGGLLARGEAPVMVARELPAVAALLEQLDLDFG